MLSPLKRRARGGGRGSRGSENRETEALAPERRRRGREGWWWLMSRGLENGGTAAHHLRTCSWRRGRGAGEGQWRPEVSWSWGGEDPATEEGERSEISLGMRAESTEKGEGQRRLTVRSPSLTGALPGETRSPKRKCSPCDGVQLRDARSKARTRKKRPPGPWWCPTRLGLVSAHHYIFSGGLVARLVGRAGGGFFLGAGPMGRRRAGSIGGCMRTLPLFAAVSLLLQVPERVGQALLVRSRVQVDQQPKHQADRHRE